jgi:hypothetical protein
MSVRQKGEMDLIIDALIVYGPTPSKVFKVSGTKGWIMRHTANVIEDIPDEFLRPEQVEEKQEIINYIRSLNPYELPVPKEEFLKELTGIVGGFYNITIMPNKIWEEMK